MTDARRIEELSLNHWPALSTLFYDGWVLRFADGYTKRANSVQPLYPSSRDLKEKVETCEKIYAENGLGTVFKMTPFAEPESLDPFLAERGYAVVDPVLIQTMELRRLRPPDIGTVEIKETITAEWIGHFCRLGGADPRFAGVMGRMLSNLRTKRGFATLAHEDRVIACGMAVVEREFVGLYDIVVDERFRGRGFGEQLVRHLLHWGKMCGAGYGYLAVIEENAPARRLYAKVGFADAYRYWYRVRT